VDDGGHGFTGPDVPHCQRKAKKEVKALLARAADALETLHKPAQGDFDHLISELRKAAELDLLRPSASG
jgi:hypothetical protein